MWYSQSYTASAAGFFSGCIGLLNHIFSAVMGQGLLLVFLAAVLMAAVFGFSKILMKETRKL